MKKSILTIMLVLSLFFAAFTYITLVNVKQAHATTYFSDSFEEAKFNPSPGVWTANATSGSSTVEISQDFAVTGTNSSKFVFAQFNDNAYAQKNLGSSYTTVYVNFVFNVTAWTGYSDTRYVCFASLGDQYFQDMILTLKDTTRKPMLMYRTDAGLQDDTSATTLSLNTVYYVGMKYVQHASFGEVKVFLNGVEVSDLTHINQNIPNIVDRIWIGNNGYGYGASETNCTYYIEDVVVGDFLVQPSEENSFTVTLNSPNNAATLYNGTQTFLYTPDSKGCGDIENATLYIWNATTGAVIATQENTTSVTNEVANSISKDLQMVGDYKWNVKVWNSTDYVWADTNYTFSISTSSPQYGTADPTSISQIRGVFLASVTNWTEVSDALASWGINLAMMGGLYNYKAPSYDSQYVPHDTITNWTAKIDALHANNIQAYCTFATMLHAYSGDGIKRNAWYLSTDDSISYGDYSNVVEYYGDGWLDIANPASWTLIRNLVRELVGNYSIDGINFDYTRWDDTFMPLGNCSSAEAITNNYDRLKFIADTGLSDVIWPYDVLPSARGGSGKYADDFMQWRAELLNEFVLNITTEALSINPNLKFGTTCHFYGAGLGEGYWNYYQGQDVNAWIKQGSLDWVAPMIYWASSVGTFTSVVEEFQNIATGGEHGLIPICPCVTNYLSVDSTTYGTPVASKNVTFWVNMINAMIDAGADGWILNKYAGTGTTTPPVPVDDGVIPDAADYFGNLSLPNPPIFTLENVTVQTLSETTCQIDWDTSIATNATIEYSSNPLYAWSQEWETNTPFYYWKNTHSTGTIVSNATLTESHTIILTNLVTPPTYIHLMSQNSSVTAFVYFSPSSTAVTVTIVSPSNTTYNSGSVYLSLSASGGTIDTIWYNIWNGTAWLYLSNQTYTTATTITDLTDNVYTLWVWANNTLGNSDYATVVFTVEISEFTWGTWWGDWW
jgi:hypothetical protein